MKFEVGFREKKWDLNMEKRMREVFIVGEFMNKSLKGEFICI